MTTLRKSFWRIARRRPRIIFWCLWFKLEDTFLFALIGVFSVKSRVGRWAYERLHL